MHLPANQSHFASAAKTTTISNTVLRTVVRNILGQRRSSPTAPSQKSTNSGLRDVPTKEYQELERKLQEQAKEVRLQAEAQVKKVRRGKDAQARTNDAEEKLNKEKCSLEEHLLHYIFQNQRLVHQKYWSPGICTTVVGKLLTLSHAQRDQSPVPVAGRFFISLPLQALKVSPAATASSLLVATDATLPAQSAGLSEREGRHLTRALFVARCFSLPAPALPCAVLRLLPDQREHTVFCFADTAILLAKHSTFSS